MGIQLSRKECSHDKINLEMFDFGIDKLTVISCEDCGEPLGEQSGDFILSEPEDE